MAVESQREKAKKEKRELGNLTSLSRGSAVVELTYSKGYEPKPLSASDVSAWSFRGRGKVDHHATVKAEGQEGGGTIGSKEAKENRRRKRS